MEEIHRHGRTIVLGNGLTATEGSDGLPTLTIRKNGKVTHRYRGSSLCFGHPLTQADKEYLITLAADSLEVVYEKSNE